MHSIKKILAFFFLFVALIAVRAFESSLFYDPFISFFKNNYLYAAIPEYDLVKLLLHMFFRNCLNTVISLGIIYCFFSRKHYLQIAVKTYVASFIVFSIVFVYYLVNKFENGYLIPFYVRRMLIHPVLLMLLLAAFFYDSKINVKK